MLTVLITYRDNTTTMVDVYSLDEISLLGVTELKVIRDTTRARVA